jgi:hypothetical protein
LYPESLSYADLDDTRGIDRIRSAEKRGQVYSCNIEGALRAFCFEKDREQRGQVLKESIGLTKLSTGARPFGSLFTLTLTGAAPG